MNRVELVGRLTKEVEMKMSASGTPVVRFTLAVNRERAKKDDEVQADFISCVAFNKTAEFMEHYLKKGYLVSVEGRIQTASYEDKQGHKVFTTDVICDSVQNLTPKQNDEKKDVVEDLNKMGVKVEVEENNDYLNLSSDDLPF